MPGLGNLLLNLAFNQSPFLVAALFDSLGPHLWGYSLLGGVLPWLGLTLSGFALSPRPLRTAGIAATARADWEKAYLISLPAWIYTLLTVNISSNSPDIASACLQIHLYLCFASFLAETDERTRLSAFGTLLVLAALSLSIKLNSVFLVAMIAVLALAVLLDSFRTGEPRPPTNSFCRASGCGHLLPMGLPGNRYVRVSILPVERAWRSLCLANSRLGRIALLQHHCVLGATALL